MRSKIIYEKKTNLFLVKNLEILRLWRNNMYSLYNFGFVDDVERACLRFASGIASKVNRGWVDSEYVV